ncbi:MAG: SH3 domain-containing protein [Hyphomicrobium sp.]
MSRILTSSLLFAFCLLAASSALRAEPDGPDYFRVVNVAADDVLNVHVEPNASSRVIGAIPPNANGVRSFGCEGGLSFSEWEKASAAQREAANHKRWCRVSYKDIEGWAAGRFLAED